MSLYTFWANSGDSKINLFYCIFFRKLKQGFYFFNTGNLLTFFTTKMNMIMTMISICYTIMTTCILQNTISIDYFMNKPLSCQSF